MARKFGKVNTMSPHFYDYNYVINGVGGIGKTTMAFELGQLATGSNEGTFIITCGSEPEPKHIPGAFGDLAKTFDIFVEIVNAEQVDPVFPDVVVRVEPQRASGLQPGHRVQRDGASERDAVAVDHGGILFQNDEFSL